LRRLLRCTGERVLVFTEYRDTLMALAAALSSETSVVTLHGGADRAARASALARFAGGHARMLIATDVAAEGLNLQDVCRLVVHVELPWSPARIEQRNGRVDRLGQRRRVHIWRLLGDARHESRILDSLSARLGRMRAAGVDVATSAGSWATPANEPPPAIPAVVQPGPDGNATQVADDLARVRRLVTRWTGAEGTRVTRMTPPWLPWRRVRAWPGGLPPGATIICLVPSSSRGSRPVLWPVHVAFTARPPGRPPRWLPEVAHLAVTGATPPWVSSPLTDALRAREQALLACAEADQARVARRWQGSLFERRTARIVEAARSGAAAQIHLHRQRLSELGEGSEAPAAVAVFALLVG